MLLGDRVQLLSPSGEVVREIALPGDGLFIAARRNSDRGLGLGASAIYDVSVASDSELVHSISLPESVHPCFPEALGRFVQRRADFGFMDCATQDACLKLQDGPWGQYRASGEIQVGALASEATFHLSYAEGSCGDHPPETALCQATDCAPLRVAPEPQSLGVDFDGSRCVVSLSAAPSPVEIELSMEPPPSPDSQFFPLEDCRLAIEGVAPSSRFVAISYQPTSAEQNYRRVVVVDLIERAIVPEISLDVEHIPAIGGIPRAPSPFVRWSHDWDILLADRYLIGVGETRFNMTLDGDAVLLR